MRALWLAVTLGVLALAQPASGFPGVLVAKDGAARRVRATSVVVMQHRGHSIVTLMVEYQGPLTPFALVVPVPSDVRAAELRTVRRGTVARVESISAPRFHLFYEQDPCDTGDTEQRWDEHVKARGPGFLDAPGLPPRDRRYAVSNDISVPVEPVFKERESEFRYRELRARDAAALAAELARSGYRARAETLAALSRAVMQGDKLLLAEVSPERAELAGGDRVQLGGLRYHTRRPVALRESLGALDGGAGEELFLFVLDRKQRFEVAGRENAFLPLRLVVEKRAAERLAPVYNALFDAFSARHPDAFVTEFAWPTSGCGEPCPDVPLAPDELLTLGGDVLEAHTASAKERAPEPGDEPILERERFEARVAELPPSERAAARREHAAERREIERRRALAARHTYVLTRIHKRYAANAARHDLELAPAPPVSGGVGVPQGARGELPAQVAPAPENRLGVRFIAFEPWVRGSECSEPKRFRWGKRWASEARAPRAVPLALDLPGASRDPALLREVLRRPLPELGIAELAATPAPAAAPPSAAPSAARRPEPRRGCSLAPSRAGGPGALGWLGLALAAQAARRRSPRGATASVRRRLPR